MSNISVLLKAQQLTSDMKKNPDKYDFKPASGKANFCSNFRSISQYLSPGHGGSENSDSPDSQPINGFVQCNICKQVLRYDAKVTGSSHLNRHAQTCKRPQTKTIQPQLTSLFNKKIKPTDAEKQGIKESQLQYCVQGHHSFKSLENEGLHSLLQTMVNIAAKHGRFDVKDLLYGRKTISEFSKLKAEELKQKLKIELTEPQEADSLAVTLDLWTDEFKHMSYLDAHAFWIDTNFELKHRMLAVRHFGIERHTSENIANAVKATFSEYNIDPSKVTATTDHGANMVAAFNALHDTGRLDCMAHRLHTCFSSMWSRACSVKPEVLQYDTAAAALAKYCNQAAGVQEQLPVSVKKGSTTRLWEE